MPSPLCPLLHNDHVFYCLDQQYIHSHVRRIFLGFEIFDSRNILGKNILASIFWVAYVKQGFLGIGNNVKIRYKELLLCVVPA